MLSKEHQKAQELAIEASSLVSRGNDTAAAQKYRDAAKLELDAFGTLPPDANRTRGILAVSVVSMLYKASDFEPAERTIYEMLARSDITTPHRLELRHLLDVIGDEIVLKESGTKYSGEEIMIALRKGKVGYGTAPVETFLHNVGGFSSLYNRTAEWKGDFPFRKRGLPPKEVQQSYQARVTQPVAGSYRFSIKLLEPFQKEMFGEPKISVSQVAESMMEVVRHTANGDQKKLKELVPDLTYRETMTKLVRNLVPLGKAVGEVELTRISDKEVKKDKRSVVLIPETRETVSALIESFAPKDGEEKRITHGVLRALDLDKGFISVTTREGVKVPLRTEGSNLFDDVVGPMVNRHVVIHSQKGRRGQFLVKDIELDHSAEEE